jgi:hypothetical protein
MARWRALKNMIETTGFFIEHTFAKGISGRKEF